MEYHLRSRVEAPQGDQEKPGHRYGAISDLAIVCADTLPFLKEKKAKSLLSPQNGDRESISLPESQVDYIKELSIAGAKIVLVVTGGSPIALGEVEDMAEAILFVWYPGMEGGRAVADVLFGDVCPSGKLPLTFPKSLEQLPAFDDYSMVGRTYRYMTQEPLYPFGFGLSYSRFEYTDLQLNRQSIKAGEVLPVKVTVRNQGNQQAAEVVQFYLSDLKASTIVPLHHLIGFERVMLDAGESRVIKFFSDTRDDVFL